MTTQSQASPISLRSGVRVSGISIAWTVASGAVAIVAGVADGSLVPIVFGATGVLDAAGSTALLLHFRHALRHEAISPRRERLALRIVAIGLVAVGVATAVESVRRLVAGAEGHRSVLAVGVACTSVVVLAVLALWKRRVAESLGSDALRADGWLSATGAGLAAVTAVGAAIGSSAGRGWIDPSAALMVAALAAGVGIAELRREETALASTGDDAPRP